ncbi:MAG: acetyl-CoA hydrolase/transferase C-terminal domain-containing protein [Dehalococcoidales bacterium]|nr:acetyl-CoA hydrolase/transferase C-terminal domain-containing protein [Dehalococcoidales bacterium]
MVSDALRSRIHMRALLSKVGTAEDVANLITDETTLAILSGDQSACPNTVLSALRQAISSRGSNVSLRLFATGPSPGTVEDILTLPNVRGKKYGQLGSRNLRAAINNGTVSLVETRVSLPSYQLKHLCGGKMDLAILECAAITRDGQLIPSTTLLDGASNIALADKVIVEINPNLPAEIEGMHDIYLLRPPPERVPVPILHATDRIGTTGIPVEPEKIALIVETTVPNARPQAQPADKDSETVAGHLVAFLEHEARQKRLPTSLLPLQFGIGSIPTAFISKLAESPFSGLEIFSGSLGEGALELIDAGKIRGISTGALYFSQGSFDKLFGALAHYKRYIVIRPSEIANCPELISRLGVIAINGAIEVDIYGHVNSTHIFGSRSIGGVGGSCDFAWNACLSVFVLKSTSADGKISTIVPMVTHVDHPEHAVDILVTEQGLADVRGMGPVERAKAIIANCAHPAYRPMLMDYLERSIARTKGHEPHLLSEAFSFHQRFSEEGTMKG